MKTLVTAEANSQDGRLENLPAPDRLQNATARNPLQQGDLNKAHSPGSGINLVLGITLLAVLAGCVGYADAGYGGAVVVPQPDVYFYGGVYERGPDVRIYSHRGFVSRREAHPRGGRHDKRH